MAPYELYSDVILEADILQLAESPTSTKPKPGIGVRLAIVGMSYNCMVYTDYVSKTVLVDDNPIH